MTTLRYALEDLVLDEVSLVDRPANPLATVILFKRDTSKEINMTDEQKLAAAIAKAVENEAAVTSLTTERDFLKSALAAQTPRLEAAEAERDTLKAAADKLNEKPAPLAPEIQAQIDSALAKANEANTELAKMRDDADTKTFVAKAESLKSLQQKPEEFGLVLKRVAQNKTTAADLTAIEDVLTKANAAIEKGILSPVGDDLGSSSVAKDQLEVLTKGLMSSEGLTYAQAYSKALDQNPKLYTQILSESRAN